jgi:hypothetical protein
MKFDEKSNFFLIPPFFISMATAAKFVQPIAIFWAYLIQLDVDATGNITAKKKFNLPTAATHYSGYSYKVSRSLMKGIQNYFKSPLFCFHGNCGKVCPTDSDFFGLSRSTTCGCCSYQVSSISV